MSDSFEMITLSESNNSSVMSETSEESSRQWNLTACIKLFLLILAGLIFGCFIYDYISTKQSVSQLQSEIERLSYKNNITARQVHTIQQWNLPPIANMCRVFDPPKTLSDKFHLLLSTTNAHLRHLFDDLDDQVSSYTGYAESLNLIFIVSLSLASQITYSKLKRYCNSTFCYYLFIIPLGVSTNLFSVFGPYLILVRLFVFYIAFVFRP
ncbi:hypothetical protein DdX_14854 [Ditylenchus destructor]|uniref:Uncharacterized protein n=1 Tax=Ditylenchus destructor TaxID=166010 RepID=A0AAD4MRE8_9BILA|nr:hypothetical protein DdX_14854 [Ditylenchus destructor]